MDSVQRDRQRANREQHTRQNWRGAQERDRAQAERIERKECGARGREGTQIRAVAVVRDHQVPRGVPAGGGSGEQIAERPKARGRPRWVEGASDGSETEREQGSRAGYPHQQA